MRKCKLLTEKLNENYNDVKHILFNIRFYFAKEIINRIKIFLSFFKRLFRDQLVFATIVVVNNAQNKPRKYSINQKLFI